MKPPITTDELRQAAEPLPRVQLAHLPTPLEELPRFAAVLGGPRVFIKRDDCTGLAFGGNKSRHNEFVLGEVVRQGADMLVWGAGVQSNNCRQTAASCAKLGIDCHLVLSNTHHAEDVQGNLLLDHILGATYEIADVPIGPQLDALIQERVEEFRAQGRKVFDFDREVIKVRAATSYALCYAELMDQVSALGIEPDAVYSCAGGATGAGLALGRAALGKPAPVHAILPIRWPWDEAEDIAKYATKTAECLGIDVQIEPSEIDISDEYVGEDYGVPTAAGMEAIALLARNEGILVDVSYSGKALGALVDQVRKGRYTSDQAIVFVHTGGTPALFAARDQIVEMIPPKKRS